MNYQQLINKFARQNKMAYDEAAHFIDSFFAVIKLNLAKGEDVKIFKLGNFASTVVKSKISKNSRTKKLEIAPDGIYPKFKASRVFGDLPKVKRAPKKKEPAAKKVIPQSVPEKKISVQTAPALVEKIKPIEVEFVGAETKKGDIPLFEKYYKKIVIFLTCFFVVFSIGLYFGLSYFKNKVIKPYVEDKIEYYLEEKGYTYEAIQEIVNSSYEDIMVRTEEYNQEMSAEIKAEIKKLKDDQERSLKKLLKMDQYLKKKVKRLIQPQLKKRKKRAQVKMKLYKVRKNDTLWSISKKYLKNPYNWVGLYQTNGEKIKNPNLIYPGQKIFIPVIKEY